MKFLVRDDDPCYYTRVEELEHCYNKVYHEVPICLSVTPFRVAGKYFPDAANPEQEMPIHENNELVAYLKEGLNASHYELALHGYSHIYHNDISREGRVPEYYTSGKDLTRKTAKAIDYLNNLFDCEINTFVPPSNHISKTGIEAIVENNLNLMHVAGFRPNKRPFIWANLSNFVKTRLWHTRHDHPVYPFPIDFGDHQEMDSHMLYPKSELNILIDQLESVHQLGGAFVLATHYHAFGKKIKSGETIGYAFNKILEKAKSLDGVEFITYRDLWNSGG